MCHYICVTKILHQIHGYIYNIVHACEYTHVCRCTNVWFTPRNQVSPLQESGLAGPWAAKPLPSCPSSTVLTGVCLDPGFFLECGDWNSEPCAYVASIYRLHQLSGLVFPSFDMLLSQWLYHNSLRSGWWHFITVVSDITRRPDFTANSLIL